MTNSVSVYFSNRGRASVAKTPFTNRNIFRLAIVAGLTTLLVWWVRRKTDPRNQITQQKSENAEAVASDDPVLINRVLDERINRVRPEQKSDADPAR